MIDSHCHLADETFAGDLEAVVSRAKEAGVERILVVLEAGNEKEAAQAARLERLWPETRFAIGVHPHQAHAVRCRSRAGRRRRPGAARLDAGGHGPSARSASTTITTFRRATCRPPCFARRSDWHASNSAAGRHPYARGRRGHARDSARGRLAGRFAACCTASRARPRWRARDSISASISRWPASSRSRRPRSSATPSAPCRIDRLLTETDSPFLAPVPHRGKRNEPAHVAASSRWRRSADAVSKWTPRSCTVARDRRPPAQLSHPVPAP